MSRTAARPPLTRRRFLVAGTLAGAALSLPAMSAMAATRERPFGHYGSPDHRLTARTLYVDPHGDGDVKTLKEAVNAATGSGWALVLAPGTYREKITLDDSHTEATWIGASEDPRDVVIVHDDANGTPEPGGGTFGTSGSATVTLEADGFTACGITFANSWLRADHPDIKNSQAVAVKVMGDRSAFSHCRFLGHQDTLYADSASVEASARQYYAKCYIEGDVDFVFGRATAVYERCRFRALKRTDRTSAPFGFVFAPSTAVGNPFGYLVTQCKVTSEAPDAFYKLARPWVPSADPTARPMLTVRNTSLSAGIDAKEPYGNMKDANPWQDQRFTEYRNTGPGAEITTAANRPQLSAEEARKHTKAMHLGGWETGV